MLWRLLLCRELNLLLSEYRDVFHGSFSILFLVYYHIVCPVSQPLCISPTVVYILATQNHSDKFVIELIILVKYAQARPSSLSYPSLHSLKTLHWEKLIRVIPSHLARYFRLLESLRSYSLNLAIILIYSAFRLHESDALILYLAHNLCKNWIFKTLEG